jgi:short-subunit dehydrogenase
MDIAGKRALVTGGSSGIGLEIARILVARGTRVVVTGRRQDQVQQAARALGPSDTVKGVPADVITSEGRRITLDTALDFLGGLDILVNNAGGMRGGRLEAIEEGEARKMIEVNLAAPILLTRLALPSLRASGEAMIVNVSSAIAQVGIAQFGESLRRELDGEGIQVLTVYPTATDTPMMATSQMRPAGGRDSAEAVARETVEAMASGRMEVVRGGADRLALVTLNRSDPAAVDRKIALTKADFERQVQGHSAL